MRTKRKDYNKRTDTEKIKTNWNITLRLYKKKEYSMAIARAITAAEIAANFVVREELSKERKLPEDFVDNLLIWANGISGKFDKLILPICKDTSKEKIFKKINAKVKDVNKERNTIVHSGEFKTKRTAKKIINEARIIIITLIKEYKSEFELNDIEKYTKKNKSEEL